MRKQTFAGMLSTMALLFVVAIVNVNAVDMNTNQKGISDQESIQIQIRNKLKLLNKPAIKTIHSRDGDIIDCVDIYKQPAFDHPALRNHKIQMKPSADIESLMSNPKKETNESITFQTWQKSGSCPDGSIPIRRIREQDLLRAASLEHFGKKTPGIANLAPTINRSIAILVTAGYNYIGAAGNLNVWNPRVESADDFSSSQIWLKNGPSDDFESIQAGWVVNPKLYGDSRTRFNIYWTADAYKSTGCFDLTCSGFVQTNPEVGFGATIEPVSAYEGNQYIISVGMNLDPNTGNWWLKVLGDIAVGYWPASLFSNLKHSATLVEWGGEVYSPKLRKSPHTTTTMGSGHYANNFNLFKFSSYVEQPRIVDYSLQLKYPERVGTYADEPSCYSAYNYQATYTTEPVFYFGGPGHSRDCP